MPKRGWSAVKKAAMLNKIRALCATFPKAVERPSHGQPTWFVGNKKSFANVTDDHHGDGRFALWIAAPPGVLAMLVDSEPDHYFVPPYVAHLGWVGVHLDRTPWKAIAALLEQAFVLRGGRYQRND
jgi:hypothetical protein